MAGGNSQRGLRLVDREEFQASDESPRVVDLSTRSVRAESRPNRGEDRFGLIVGLAIAALLIGITAWTIQASQERPGRPAASESQKIADWRSGVRLPDLSAGRELTIGMPQPATQEPGSALAPPDLSPVLADPPATTDLPSVTAQLPEPIVQAPRGSPVVFDAGAGESTVGFAFESDNGREFGGAVKSESAPPARRSEVRVASPRPTANQIGMLGRGTVIPAILESAIDSSIAGGVRAVVSTDVLASDGKRTLVPRSSRLIGQYRARQSGDQKSAFVVWTQIVQPDGRKHDITSSVSGSGDKKFFEKFASAKLVSVIAGQEAAGFRARQGEPLRVTAVRDLDLAKAK